ncbi:hypothetical protein [Nonomuraea sp. NPDC046570]|uniref:hypothetical protein n=1 Tax=Nonomuraea sp. NPDC046570 TaxID=3155255 RepID=UPI0033C1802E
MSDDFSRIRRLSEMSQFSWAHVKADQLILARPGDPAPVLMKALVLAQEGRLDDGRLVLARADQLGLPPGELRDEVVTLLGDGNGGPPHPLNVPYDLMVALTGAPSPPQLPPRSAPRSAALVLGAVVLALLATLMSAGGALTLAWGLVAFNTSGAGAGVHMLGIGLAAFAGGAGLLAFAIRLFTKTDRH